MLRSDRADTLGRIGGQPEPKRRNLPGRAVAILTSHNGEEDMSQMDRKTLLERAGMGAGALTLPALFGAEAAFAGPPNGQRIYLLVAFSQAPPVPGGPANPRLLVVCSGNFKPDAGQIRGGGSWTLLNWNGTPGTATLIDWGLWQPSELVNYQSFTPAVGATQASIIDMLADFEGLANNAAMKLICNIGPAGILTGQPEGYKATIPGYGEFVPIGLGLSHTSIEGMHLSAG